MRSPEVLRDYIEIPQGVDVFHFHLASYFLVRKDGPEIAEILRAHGLGPVYDPARTPMEIQKKLWDKRTVDESGYFTFPPRKLILGHTTESIIVPPNLSLRMRDYFVFKKTGEVLPLKTNLGSPLIHPGSMGPQTYEIYNEGDSPLRIHHLDVICIADVFLLRGPSLLAQSRDGGLSQQQTGEISLGDSFF